MERTDDRKKDAVMLKKRRLGKTDIEVSSIGLGVMQFSGKGLMYRMMLSDIPQGETDTIIKAAFEGGINWFDTAEMYGFGRSEHSLVAALSQAGIDDDDIIIGTKWNPLFRTARNIPRSIMNRVRFLESYSIDLYMVHNPFGFSQPEDEMNAMADLVDAGIIRSVGVSNFSAERMRRAHTALDKRGLPLAVNQVQYNLLHRDIEKNGVLETAKELGVTIVAWGPLASGLLTGRYHKDPEILAQTPPARRWRFRQSLEKSQPVINALEEIAARYGVTPGQVALNWLIHFNGDTVVAIPGASRVRHAQESAGAMKFRLDEDDLAYLDRITR
jgi:aryl-alcohol dehydrogenase-like predicted oxidoreductase